MSDVDRVKKKLNRAPKIPEKTEEELPSLEVNTKTEAERKVEVEKLRVKSEDGAVGMVTNIVKRPEVQSVLKSNINRQTFISGTFMACLLIGFLQITMAGKSIFQWSDWIDFAIGLLLIAVGGVYMAKMLIVKDEKPKIDEPTN